MNCINSPTHPLIKHFVRLCSQRKYRYEQRKVIIEGEKMIREAAEILPIRTLLTCEKALNIEANELFQVPLSIIEKISHCEHPEGMIAEIDMPSNSDLSTCQTLLALDQIGDPGNMGTLIRTALAFGWKGVYLIDGCCDPYNDKALRAAKGATFKIPIEQGSMETLKKRAKNYQALAADLNGMKAHSFKRKDAPLLLLLGNESQGVSAEAKTFCEAITLPIQNIDSLNVSVAGGILMYLLENQ